MKALKSLEPKQQKTFRDRYLAVLFAVAALLISSVVSAQLDSAKYSPINGYGFKYKRMVFDSVLMIPRSTSPHVPWRAGAIRYNAPDSTLQLWTGNQWNSILTGIGNGVDTAYMIDDTLMVIETPDEDFLLTIPGRPQRFGLEDATTSTNRSFNFNNFTFEADSFSNYNLYSKVQSAGVDRGVIGQFRSSPTSSYLWHYHSNGVSTRSYGFNTYPQLTQMFAAGHMPGHATYVQSDTLQVILEADPNRLYMFHDSVALHNINGGDIDFRIRTLPETIDTTNFKPLAIGPLGQVKKVPGWPGSGGGATPSWQQTLDVSHNTSGRLLFDTSYTKPVDAGSPAQHTWFTMMPLVKEDDTVTSPFYWNQFAGLNNGQVNEVMMFGWNLGPGGGQVQAGKPALGESWESNYRVDIGGGNLRRYMEKHEYYINPAGLQFRLGSYTINTDDGTCNYYHSVDNFNLRNFGTAGTNTPYFTVQGVANNTQQALINNSDQAESFNFNADFNQDANTSALSITSGAGKPVSLFNLVDFTSASFPNISITGQGYDGAEILFNGFTDGQLGRLLVDSSQANWATFTNVPMHISPNSVNVLDIRSNRVNAYQHMSIQTGGGTPIAMLDVRSASEDQTLYIENGKAGGYGAIITSTNGTGGNVGLDITATGTAANKGINFNASMAATDWNIYSAGASKTYLAGKVGLGVTSPTSYLHIKAGTATANTAPIKIDAGTNLTTPEDGAIEYDGTHYYATVGSTRYQLDQQAGSPSDEAYSATTWNGSLDAATKNALRDKFETMITSLNSQTGAVTITAGNAISTSTLSGDITIAVDVNHSTLPHTIATYFTDVANSGTGETDLYSTTTSANTLSGNGQTLYFDYTVNMTDNTSTAALAVYFGATQIGTTGALTVSSTGYWRVTGSITRATSTTARATVVVTAPGGSTTLYVNETDLTSQNFATTNVVKITGQAGGAGGGTGDITAKMGKLYYQP
jgi:hypothetical protein